MVTELTIRRILHYYFIDCHHSTPVSALQNANPPPQRKKPRQNMQQSVNHRHFQPKFYPCEPKITPHGARSGVQAAPLTRLFREDKEMNHNDQPAAFRKGYVFLQAA